MEQGDVPISSQKIDGKCIESAKTEGDNEKRKDKFNEHIDNSKDYFRLQFVVISLSCVFITNPKKIP